jgi:hypothetical protein
MLNHKLKGNKSQSGPGSHHGSWTVQLLVVRATSTTSTLTVREDREIAFQLLHKNARWMHTWMQLLQYNSMTDPTVHYLLHDLP